MGKARNKKLIVSRQPIFTNLKSNTMKNNAKIGSYSDINKQIREYLWRSHNFFTDRPGFATST